MAFSKLRELRRRRLFGTIAIYIVASWVLIQVASEAFPAFNIPEFAIRYVWIAVALGFPLALLVGWRYDISSRGIVRTAVAGSGSEAATSLQRADILLLSGVAVAAAGIALVMLGEIAKFREPLPEQLVARKLDPNSVAVLPLDNFTGDPDQEYFVDALHEALTAGLTAISSLTVISRTSASTFVGSNKSLPEIGRALGVANIIEGSVFRSGDRVRITLQLIDTLTDEHLWAENFEREMVDLLTLQGEVTRAVANQIRVALTPEEDARLDVEREVDPKVFQLYLKGMYFLHQYTPQGIEKGLPYLHQAVEQDPNNPRAWASLALGYNSIGHGIGRDAFPKALAAARRALELDEYSGEAWAALAEAQLYYDYDWHEADRSFQRALQLAPSLAHAHAHYAYLLILLDRWDEAFVHSRRATELSPLDPTWAWFRGWLYMSRGDFEAAESHFRDALEIDPGNPFALLCLGDLRRMQGRVEEAIALQEQIPLGNPVRNWALGPTFALSGRTEDALAIAEAMKEDPGPKDKLYIGATYAGMGDYDQAMHWLNVAYEGRTDWLPWIAINQVYPGLEDEIRLDPRFQALVDRLNIPKPEGDRH